MQTCMDGTVKFLGVKYIAMKPRGVFPVWSVMLGKSQQEKHSVLNRDCSNESLNIVYQTHF